MSSVGQVTHTTVPSISKTVGNYIGTIGKLGNRCWEAKEPLRTLFHTQIRPGIVDRLDGIFGSVSTQTSIIITFYMIGRRANTAVPTILFVSENESNRKDARKLIKECGILKQYRGWKTAQASVDPGWGAGAQLEQLASGSRTSGIGSTNIPATRVLYDISQPVRSQGMALYISHDSGVRRLTANFIRLHGKEFYLAPAHAFFDRKDEPQGMSGASEDDFEMDSDDETETIQADDDVYESPATEFDCLEFDAWSSSDDSEVSDIFSAQDSGDEALSQSSFGSTESSDIEATINYGVTDGAALQATRAKFRVPVQDLRTPAMSSLAPFGVLSRWSVDKDWALVEVFTKKRSISAFLAKNPEDLSTMSTSSSNPAGVAILTHTASGRELTGVMSGTPSDMCVPQGTSFQQVFSVRLDGPLADGDCGSAVVDAISGELYGHIVAGCRTTGFAYVMAAYHVMPDLYEAVQAYEPGSSIPGSAVNNSVSADLNLSLSVPLTYPAPVDFVTIQGLDFTPSYSMNMRAFVMEDMAAELILSPEPVPVQLNRFANLIQHGGQNSPISPFVPNSTFRSEGAIDSPHRQAFWDGAAPSIPDSQIYALDCGNEHLDPDDRVATDTADVSFKDNNGCSPLALAALTGHGDLVEFLLPRRANTDVNAVDAWSYSRLNIGGSPYSGLLDLHQSYHRPQLSPYTAFNERRQRATGGIKEIRTDVPAHNNNNLDDSHHHHDFRRGNHIYHHQEVSRLR